MFRLFLSPGMISFIVFVLRSIQIFFKYITNIKNFFSVLFYTMVKIMKTYERTTEHLKREVLIVGIFLNVYHSNDLLLSNMTNF